MNFLIDGHHVTDGEKYTILELGYAILMADDPSARAWLAAIGRTIHGSDAQGRSPFAPLDGLAATDDPVVVALSYLHWHARNTGRLQPSVPWCVPTEAEAVRIVRDRHIANDFNLSYAGRLASEGDDDSTPPNIVTPDAFRLRFAPEQIEPLAARYDMTDEERFIEKQIVPAAKARTYLHRDELLTLCHWKSQRNVKRYALNDEVFVRDTTAVAFGSNHERLRIEVLTLLHGVDWPTASVLLHWCASGAYPILDFRALYSFDVAIPRAFTYSFWQAYTHACRRSAIAAGVSMRTLDRALWQFSKENQKPPKKKGSAESTG